MIIYKITNLINGKIYIGKSKDYLKRFRTHIKIAKGGKENYPRKY
jgi:predicted GIY-YIG superfamily endonuclease